MNEQENHDLLITIVADFKWVKEWMVNHSKEDAITASKMESIATAAHKRIDKTNERFNWLVISGVLALILFSVSIWLKQ